MQVKKYVKLPIAIEAVQWDGTAEGATPILNWILSEGGSASYVCDEECTEDNSSHSLSVQTLEDRTKAGPGWYIIRGTKGEFYPCHPDVFEECYREAEDE